MDSLLFFLDLIKHAFFIVLTFAAAFIIGFPLSLFEEKI